MTEDRLMCKKLAMTLQECDPDMGHLDYAFAKGYLTASVISPTHPSMQTIIDTLLEAQSSLSSLLTSQLIIAINDELKHIDRQLNADEEINTLLPTDREEALPMWCTGFLEAHFQQADDWLQDKGQEVSELLLPIMLISGLFDDEPEFKSMISNQTLLTDMIEQLPEVITELYLLFRE